MELLFLIQKILVVPLTEPCTISFFLKNINHQ